MRTAYIIIGVSVVMFVLILVLSGLDVRRYLPRKLTWEEKVARPEITEEEFTRVFTEAVRSRYTSAKVQVSGPLEVYVVIDSREFKCWLDNAWKQCASYPETRAEVCERYIQGLDDTIKAGEMEFRPDSNSIVPIIKSDLYLDSLPEQGDGTKPLFTERLAGDILIAYGQLIGNGVMFLDESGVRDLNLGMEEIRELSIRNLRAALGEIRRYGEGPVYILTAAGMESASLLLVDKIWDEEAELVRGELVAAVPCRDTIVFTGSETNEALAKVRSAAEKIYEKEPYAISTTLIVRRNGKWVVFDESPSEK